MKNNKRNRLIVKLGMLGAVALCTIVASAETLDTSSFTMKRTVTFSGYAGASDLENFPALVRLPADISARCVANGADIRFADADGNLLNHEIDTWNTNGESCVWVCVPRLSGNSTSITLYYGGFPTQPVNPRLVWGPSEYKAVWHFSGSDADSSTNALECKTGPQTPKYTDAGPVGTTLTVGAKSSLGENTFVYTTNDLRWAAYGTKLTLSGWVKAEGSVGNTGFGRIFSTKDTFSREKGFELSIQGSHSKYNFIGDGKNQHQAESYNCSNDFVYVTAVCDGSMATLYANGAEVANWNDLVLQDSTNRLYIGSSAKPDNYWNGQLDEMRLRWSASSADWVAADYATQHAADFAVLGAAERIDSVPLDNKPFRRVCTVTFVGYAGSSTLWQFPALVRIPAGSPIYQDCAADGSDIRFVDAEGYLVDHEIDTWNANGESLIWVRVPQLEGTSTALLMYFCCRGENVSVNPRNVWAYAGFKGVWHFSGSNADSSPNALVCENSSTPPSFSAVGSVGTAFSSTGSAFVQTANDPRWANYGSDLTLSCWAKANSVGYSRIITSKNAFNDANGFELTLQNSATIYNTIGDGSYAKFQSELNGANCSASPVYVTSVMSNGGVTLYSNGAVTGTSTDSCPLTPSTRALGLGKFPGSSNAGWNGTLDEMRLRWIASSADWVAADYATQCNASFAVLGEIEKINTPGMTLFIR